MALPPDPNLIVITNVQMYGELRALSASQQRVELTLAGVAETQRTAANDHETRLRALESRRWPLPVACALMSLVSCGSAIYAIMQQH